MPAITGNAAHSVLFCQDTLLEIFGYLSPGWFSWDHSDRGVHLPNIEKDLKSRRLLQNTLASCALTCRAFSDLALAELWKILDHHVFLLKLLPWTAGEDGLFDEVIDLEPDIDEQTWSRFRWYARLVREMKAPVHTDVQLNVRCSTWALLASRLGGEPLLPFLRRLQMPANLDNIAPLLFSFSPTIRTFTLEFERLSPAVEDKDFLAPFLTLISDPSGHTLLPSICQLITREGDGDEVMQHFRTSARLQMLEELDLTKIMYSVDHSSIATLSRLPSLCTLKTGLSIWDSSAIPLFTFAGFTNLRHLSLSLLPLPIFSAMLATSGLRASQLRSITVQSGVRTADRWHEVPLPIAEFQHHLALIRAALPDTLEALNFWFIYSTRAESPELLSTLFAPFLSLGHLKTFDVSFSRGYVPHVLDDDLHALVAAWPHLEVLRVWVWEMRTPMFSSARPPTVAGLVELAKGCPRLCQVTLPALDVSALPEISAFPLNEGHRGVRFLDVCALVKDDGVAVEDVARVLDRLFPCIEEHSRNEAGPGTPQVKSWREVQGAMQEIEAARWRRVGRE